jgi:NAD(P)-dependent dehydrogenase (short-subunit alcohol dehydrogenase family)
VTGAAGAMGAACAHAVAAGADTVLMTDVDGERLAGAAAAVERAGEAKVDTVAGDLGDPSFVAALAARAGALGDVHALVHTAGLSPSMAGWQEILRVDLVAVAHLLDAFLPHVVAGSAAVCLASVSAHMGVFDAATDAALADPLAAGFEERFRALAGDDPDPGATYRLAKRGVVLLCERAAVVWGARGGRVVSCSPGLVDTAMGRLELEHNPIKTWMAELTPLASLRLGPDAPLPGRVDDIAEVVAFLCSERAAFVSGCDVRVDGGLLAAMGDGTQTR